MGPGYAPLRATAPGWVDACRIGAAGLYVKHKRYAAGRASRAGAARLAAFTAHRRARISVKTRRICIPGAEVDHLVRDIIVAARSDLVAADGTERHRQILDFDILTLAEGRCSVPRRL